MKFLVLVLALAVWMCSGYEILQQIPVTFGLKGNISYTPTSGGVNIPGYIFKVGFNNFGWIGVKFMTLTSRSTYDVLVIKRDSAPVGGYYKTTVTDYYMSSARTDRLMTDTNNNMDKQAISYSNSNYFQLEIYRTKGDTQGEDWQGGDFVNICFYTSSTSFNQNSWTNLKESCYGYDVSVDYISTFRGRSITTMSVSGINMQLYGGVEGPFLELQLFWYAPNTNLSNSDVYIKIGAEISTDLGYDYAYCGNGDYFGKDINSLTPDTLWSGYNDGQCVVSALTSSTKISLAKAIYTNDQLDGTITNNPSICITVGTTESCADLKLEILFPVMSVDSALVIYQTMHLVQFTILITILAIMGL